MEEVPPTTQNHISTSATLTKVKGLLATTSKSRLMAAITVSGSATWMRMVNLREEALVMTRRAIHTSTI